MYTIPCKNCNEDLHYRTSLCPKCNTTNPTTKTSHTFGTLLFIIVIGYGFLYIVSDTELTADEIAAKKMAHRIETCSNKFDAIYMSTVFVQDTLASPSTAKFPSAANNRVVYKYLDGCEHHINSYVDAQNLYGATVRNEYYAILKYSIEHDSWSLIDLSL